MANTIRIRRSSVASAVPTTAQLALGELAVNTRDGKLFLKKDNGTQSIVEVGAGGGGGTAFTSSATAPSAPAEGDEWFDEDTGILYTYITDSSTSQWVELGTRTQGPQGPQGIPGTVTDGNKGEITVSGSGTVWNIYQTFRLTANGAATTTTIADYFGATSSINLAANSVYEIEYFAYFQKNTAGTLVWTHTASSAPTLISSFYRAGPVTGAAGTPTTLFTISRGATTAAFGATASISNSAFMTYGFHTRVITNAATNFRLRVTNSAGTVTPQAGSFYTVRQVSGTTGSFAV